MVSSKAIGIPAAIVAGIVLIFFFISAPNIEINMYHTNDSGDFKGSTFAQTEVKQIIHKEDSRFGNWSPACFRIKNLGQEVQAQTKIAASNFRVQVQTNAICDNCDTYTDYTKLEPQESIEPCKKIKVPADLVQVTFEISVYYDAIIPRYETTKFVCEKIDENENSSDFVCNIS